MAGRFLRRAITGYQAWSVLAGGVADVLRLRSAQRGARGEAPAEFRVRALPGVPLLCRPGTTDAIVLLSTFAGRYHLPPTGADPLVALDLGANVGYVAAHLAGLYPRARVISVELDPGNAEIARRNLRPFGSRCEVVEAAAWTREGRVAYDGRFEQSFAVVADASAAKGGATTTTTDATPGAVGRRTARAVTINTLLAERGIARVDYVKMDVEGAEGVLLVEAVEWLATTSSLKVEVHRPVRVEQIEADLRRAGFSVARDRRHRACVVASRGG